MDIEKAKKRCNELTKEHAANWIGISNQEAIEVLLNQLDKKEKIIDNAKQWIEDTMNDSHIVGCNLGDLQMLLDILESED